MNTIVTNAEHYNTVSVGIDKRPLPRYKFYERLYDEFRLNLVATSPYDGKATRFRWAEYQTARLDPDDFWSQLSFAKRENVNMAIITGAMPWHTHGLVVLDPDDDAALEFARQRIERERGVKTACKAKTGNGQHWYFRHPRNCRLKNIAGFDDCDGEHINLCIKADGGVITAPGSIHANGRLYTITREWTPEMMASVPVFEPKWFPEIDFSKSEHSDVPDCSGFGEDDDNLVPLGDREHLAWRMLERAGGFRTGEGVAQKGVFKMALDLLYCYALPFESAFELFCRWGELPSQNPAWRPGELRHTLESAVKQGRGDRRYVDEVLRTKLDDKIDAAVSKFEPDSGALAEDADLRAQDVKSKKPTQTQVLVKLALERAKLFHTADGSAYAAVTVKGHEENWPVNSGGFRRWLKAIYYELRSDAPNEKAVGASIDILCHMALEGGHHEVHLRLAKHAGNIYVDLADEAWRAVEVTPIGWRVVERPPVHFRRTRNTGSLPVPVRGGNLDELRPLLGTTDANWTLVKGWLVDCFKGRGPYLVLVVTGEQGSAKSSLCRLLRSLVDPLKKATLASLPRDEKDLGVDGTNEFVLAYDNVSFLPQWLSDCLCRAATGGGIKSRALYTDGEQAIFDICAPIILNGIPDFAESNDLLGRSLIIHQPFIPESDRLDEETLAARFDIVRAKVFGALLDAVSVGLANVPSVKMSGLPRMADSTKWITACFGDERFLEEYRANIENAVDLGLEASPIANIIRKLVLDAGGSWEGTMSELFENIKQEATGQEFANTFPKNVAALRNRIKRDAPALRSAGINHDRGKSNGKKWIRFWASPGTIGSETGTMQGPSK